MSCALSDEGSKVKTAIVTSRTLRELRYNLAAVGYAYDSIATMAGDAKRLWWDLNTEELGSIENLLQPSQSDELPYTEIHNAEILYRIHGIPTDTVIPYPAHFILPSETKKLIQAKVEQFCVPQEDYLLEEGFASLFDLDGDKEMDDISFRNMLWYSKRYLPITEAALGLTSPEALPGKPENLLESLQQHEGIIRRYLSAEILAEVVDQLKLLPFFLELVARSTLPQPLEMQYNSLRSHLAKRANIECATAGYFFAEPLRIKYIAQYAKLYAANNHLKILHIVENLYQESETEYFLNHPKYLSFKIDRIPDTKLASLY